MSYPWYKSRSSQHKISQGDIILDLVVPAPQFDSESQSLMKTAYKRKNVIVMTQACDLEQEKVDFVKVCELVPLNRYIENELILSVLESRKQGIEDLANIDKSPIHIDYNKKKKTIDKLLKKLRSGGFLDLYLLNEENQIGKMDAHIVNLRKEYILPYKSIKNFIETNKKERLSLQPPYREHLNQAYVNLYSRIGLPQDIEVEKFNLQYKNDFEYENWKNLL